MYLVPVMICANLVQLCLIIASFGIGTTTALGAFDDTTNKTCVIPGQVYKTCASACTATCDEPTPRCNKMCVQKCTCPVNLLLHERRCVAKSDCPTGFNATIQRYHNKLRKMHSAKGLTWNDDVSKRAQNWCDQLVKGATFENSSDRRYGENLYRTSEIIKNMTLLGGYATMAWYSQEQYWDYERSTSKDGNETGNFTQVVWKNTTELGCGYAINDGANNTLQGTFVCCNYKPPGNYRGGYAENVGNKTDSKPDPTRCEWRWGNWTNCIKGYTRYGKIGCFKTMEQYCSCYGSSKCSEMKEAAKREACQCENNTCKWRWKKGECKKSLANATPCKRRVEQVCSCEDESKCSAADKKRHYEEECKCQEGCKWKWGNWTNCITRTTTSGTTGCYKTMEQYCSCNESSKCSDMKDAPKREVCKCENSNCTWEWESWTKCQNSTIAGTTGCYRWRKQVCNCVYGYCKTDQQQDMQVERCHCNNTDNCEWQWGKWGRCLSADAATAKCSRIIEQECSCKSEADCEGSKKTKREMCKCGKIYARLLGGKKEWGNLAVMSNSTEGWTSVCDDGWGDRESNVACRNIGFKYGKLVSTELFQKNNLSFAWSEVDCPASATNLHECKASKYGMTLIAPCHWKEKVALKCCNEKFKFELTDVAVKCKKKGVKCKFNCTVNGQKMCQNINMKDVDVQIYHIPKSGVSMLLGSLKYRKKKNTFYGKNKFESKPDSDCFVFVAQIAGMIRVKKSIGTC